MHELSKDNEVSRQSTFRKVFKEEKYYSKETPNQQELRITELATFDIHNQAKKKWNYSELVNIKKDIFLKADGSAFIIFDVWKLKKYTCAIANPNSTSIWYTVEISPDNDLYSHYKKKKEIVAPKLEIVDCIDVWLRYVKIRFTGEPGLKVIIYLQGVKDE